MQHIRSRGWVAVLSVVALGSVVVCGTVVAQERFPNLTKAEDHLNAALDALNTAPDRFGGHKAEAIRLVRAALGEVEQAKAAFH